MKSKKIASALLAASVVTTAVPAAVVQAAVTPAETAAKTALDKAKASLTQADLTAGINAANKIADKNVREWYLQELFVVNRRIAAKTLADKVESLAKEGKVLDAAEQAKWNAAWESQITTINNYKGLSAGNKNAILNVFLNEPRRINNVNMLEAYGKAGKVTQAQIDKEKAAVNAMVNTTLKNALLVRLNAIKVPVKEVVAVKSIAVLANNKVEILLENAITVVPEVSKVQIKNAAGQALEVKSIVLGKDGKSLIVVTAAQTAYAPYTLTLNEVSKTYVAVPVDTVKPTITSAVVTGNTEFKVVFSEKVDYLTATNIANYTIDNSLVVLKAELDSDGKTVLLTTSSQSVGTIYNVTIQNVADLAGNVADKYTGMFGGMAKDTTKPVVSSAVVTGNTEYTVVFNEKVDPATATNIANYTIDNKLVVLKAEIDSADKTGKTVILTTSEQTVGSIYNITIQNVTDVAGNVMDKYTSLFGGMAKDTIKPSAPTIVVTDNNKVSVTFAEKMNKTLAENIGNYSIDNSLVVLKAELNDAGTVVTLTTSAQTVGTIYTVTVQNLADIAGNVMDKATALFGGMAKDTVAPTVTSVTSAANTVTVTYSEKVDKDTATNVLNYVFDGSLGYATSAALNDAGTVVTLTTAAQTPGKVYNVTINGVQDANSNTIAKDTKKSFVGVGTTAASTFTLQAVSIVDENTFDLVFDRDLSTAEVTALVLGDFKKNGQDITVGADRVKMQQSNKRVVRVQFKNDKFTPGNVYEVKVTGGSIVTANKANIKTFAGTNVQNPAPYATTAVALNKTAVKVTFSEAVKGLTAGEFTITKMGTSTTVAVSDVTNASGTEVTLVLGANLEDSAVYELTFNGVATDEAGYATLKKTNADGKDYKVNFAGTNVVNAAPKASAVVAVDKYTFDVVFSESVKVADLATLATKLDLFNETNNVAVSLTNAKLSLSADGTKLTVKLDSKSATLASGKIYKLTYDTTSAQITDKQGLAYDTAKDANIVKFAGTDVVNAAPEIVAVTADASADQLTVVFSEAVYGSIDKTDFVVVVDGTTLVLSGAATTDNVTFTISSSTDFASGKTGTIKVQGTNIVDANNQVAKTDAVTFGTR